MNEQKIPPVITIDGPSGTGKGTLCHRLAKQLAWNFLDSGAIYRVLALGARRQAIDFNSVELLANYAKSLDFYFELDAKNTSHIYLDNRNCTLEIRSEQCAHDASTIATIPLIRDALLMRQRQFATWPGLVADGRDMGTVVFPDAIIKIYLDAKLEERSKRRYFQLKNAENNVSLAQVATDLMARDTRDTAREYAPLKAASDAIQIDTTERSIDEVFELVLDLVARASLATSV